MRKRAGTREPGRATPRRTVRKAALPRRGGRRAGAIVLFIVAPDQLAVYEHLKEAIAKMKHVKVIPDRRRRRRRQEEVAVPLDRRRVDRRARPHVEEQLRVLGWLQVRL